MIDKIFKYILDKRNKALFFITLLTFLYFLFIQKIDDLIGKYLVPILSECRSDLKNDLLFGIFFLLIPLYIIWMIRNKRSKLSLNSILISIILLLLYTVHRIQLPWQDWNFTPFWTINKIKYFDIIIVSLITFLLEFPKNPISQQLSGKRYFIDDTYKTFGNIDLLKRERFASEIVEFISGTTSQNSFAIGILGNWGSGKTVFLNHIYEKLNPSFVKIRFNPWRSNDPKLILADFFSSLTSELKLYDPYLSKQINNYASALLSADSFSFIKYFKPIYHLIYPEKSLQEQYSTIKDSITDFKLKIILFIDDLDRLDKKEILEVLRIIRNAVDFPNTYFLVAYEQTFILKSIKSSKIAEGNRYLEKIFQLEITLPSYPEFLIRNALYSLLKENRPIDEFKELESALNSICDVAEEMEFGTNKYNLLQDHIVNLRDVVRLVNSFNLNYNFKKGEVDLIDYLIIEIIGLKYYRVYKSISRQLIKGNFDNYFELEGGFTSKKKKIKFNQDKFDAFWNNDPNLKKNYDLRPVSRSIEYLFNRLRPIPNLRAIIYPENGLIYFSADLFGNISFKEFSSARKSSKAQFLNAIEHWIQEEKSTELIRIFTETNQYSDVEDFENMICGMIYLSKIDPINWRYEIYSRLKGVIQIAEIYYDRNTSLYKGFLNQIFENATYPYYFESSLASDFLYPLLNKEPAMENFFTETELKEIIVGFLNSYCQSDLSKEVNDNSFSLFYNSQDKINQPDRRITIIPSACKIFRTFVEKNPESYIKKLIRPLYTPPDGKTFTLEPFIAQTFECYDNFEIFLKNQKNTFFVLEVKTFYHRYKNNDNNAIQFERGIIEFYSGTDTEFIKSTKYPEIVPQKNVITYKHPYDSKIFTVSEYYNFKFANWIAHQYPIDENQANEGGDYLLRYTFNIDEPIDNLYGSIQLFVDDYCELRINNGIVSEKINTGNLTIKPDDEILSFSDDFPILLGKNIIDFNIINNSAIDTQYGPKTRIKGEDNPYGIIFIIYIKTKNRTKSSF